jgi:hypothetical protein
MLSRDYDNRFHVKRMAGLMMGIMGEFAGSGERNNMGEL